MLPEDDLRIETCRSILSDLMLNNLRLIYNIQGVPLATEAGIEDIATKFEKEYVRCVRNEEDCVCSASNCGDTEQRSAK